MTAQDFHKNGFTIVRNMYNVKGIFEYTKSIKHKGEMDPQTPFAPSFYKDLVMSQIQIKLLSKMEKETGLKLYPTYNYFRIYNLKSILKKHTDRSACEISLTMNLGYDGDYNWSIWITGNDKKDYEVTLEPGDCAIYKGCKNEHWREDADKRVKCQSQLFLHYVDQEGPYTDCIFDLKRKE